MFFIAIRVLYFPWCLIVFNRKFYVFILFFLFLFCFRLNLGFWFGSWLNQCFRVY